MKYLAMIYGDESRWEALSDDERSAVYARYRAFGDAAGDKVVGGAELGPNSTATTVRVREGETIVTDGPFVETKEVVGGFDILECGSLEEAVEIASEHPVAQMGTIEVRPLWGQ